MNINGCIVAEHIRKIDIPLLFRTVIVHVVIVNIQSGKKYRYQAAIISKTTDID